MSTNLDPAQLVALHALLDERHVTRAAKRLGVTQSTMSHRLRQLRQSFGDPLLVRAGGELVLTARAARMVVPLAQALDALRQSVAEAPAFEPSRATLKCTLALPDLLSPLLLSLVEELSQTAPGVDLRMLNVPSNLPEGLAQGSPMMAIAPISFVSPSIVARPLGKLRFCVVSRIGHPSCGKPLTTKRWLAYPHVVVRIDNQSANVVAGELSKHGLQRRVAVEVPSFLAGLMLVASSDFLMNAPVPLARDVAKLFGLTIRESPIALPAVAFALVWHERYKHDPAHRWLRELVLQVARNYTEQLPELRER